MLVFFCSSCFHFLKHQMNFLIAIWSSGWKMQFQCAVISACNRKPYVFTCSFGPSWCFEILCYFLAASSLKSVVVTIVDIKWGAKWHRVRTWQWEWAYCELDISCTKSLLLDICQINQIQLCVFFFFLCGIKWLPGIGRKWSGAMETSSYFRQQTHARCNSNPLKACHVIFFFLLLPKSSLARWGCWMAKHLKTSLRMTATLRSGIIQFHSLISSRSHLVWLWHAWLKQRPVFCTLHAFHQPISLLFLPAAADSMHNLNHATEKVSSWGIEPTNSRLE